MPCPPVSPVQTNNAPASTDPPRPTAIPPLRDCPGETAVADPIGKTAVADRNGETAAVRSLVVGGKGGPGVWQAIINQMPPHDVYIEPFLGNGSVLLHKRPARLSIGIDLDPEVIQRFERPKGCELVCGNSLSWLRLRKDWTGSELIYADPPYLLSTRNSQRRYYRCEMLTEPEHAEFLRIARSLPCKVVISGYWSALYVATLPDWRTVKYTAVDRRGRRREEILWCNFPEPFALHDYRFLGRDHRQRQDIRRKTARWKNKLAKMPLLERAGILAAISDLSR